MEQNVETRYLITAESSDEAALQPLETVYLKAGKRKQVKKKNTNFIKHKAQNLPVEFVDVELLYSTVCLST